ncbi:C-type mannose receptor 2-like [Chanos chanos]|uniref:C-type mannose receptor 2-like n=1 Tax=Chanos chanos TaxID=29144 RepID=A0A6J2VSK4_CHACN|nr:C-type mannose receptor 2-like [Chanos chanos]
MMLDATMEPLFLCFDAKNFSHPYKLMTTGRNWSEAQSYCREQYTDMVTVRNETENEKIRNMITESGMDGNAWIGLYRDNWAWSDGSKSSFRYWNKNQTDNQGGIENCAEITPHTRDWNDQSCSVQQPFICYQDKLVLIRENKTWSEALSHCRNNHVDLVSVHDENMIRWVKERAKNATTDYVWLGLRFSCTLGFWFWVDGESVCYQNLVPGNWTKVEVCQDEVLTGAIKSRVEKQEWVSLPETRKLNFICSAYEGESSQALRSSCTVTFWFQVSGEPVAYNNWTPGNGTKMDKCETGGRTGVTHPKGEEQKWVSLPESHKLIFICSTD